MLTPKVLGLVLIMAGLIGDGISVALNSKLIFFYSCMSGLFGIAACIRILANPETLKNKYFVVFGINGEIAEQLVINLCSVGARVFIFRQDAEVFERLVKRFPDNVIPLQRSEESNDYTSSLTQIESVLKNKTLKGVIFADDDCAPGDAELLPQQRITQMLERNVVEVVGAVKAFLPLLRESKGRVVFLGHVFGRFPIPAFSAFSLTKSALEGFADGLRHEMRRFDVKVSTVECCGHSPIGKSERLSDSMWSEATQDARETYGEEYVRRITQPQVRGTNGPVLQTLLEAIAAENPKDRYLVCSAQRRWCLSKMETIASQFVPATVMDIWVDIVHALPPVLRLPPPALK